MSQILYSHDPLSQASEICGGRLPRVILSGQWTNCLTSDGKKGGKWKIKAIEGGFHLKNMADNSLYTLKKEAQKHKNKPSKPIKETWDSLKACEKHPYLTAKQVKTDLKILKTDAKGVLYIPSFSIETDKQVGWQTIYPKPLKSGKWGKYFHNSNKDVYCPLGGETDRLYIAEGVATALSIKEITQHQVWMTFGKLNLNAVAKKALKEHTSGKTIILCLDNDTDQFKPSFSDPRLKVLCPDNKGDFNDYQKFSNEKDKLKFLTPVFKYDTPNEGIDITLKEALKSGDPELFVKTLFSSKERVSFDIDMPNKKVNITKSPLSKAEVTKILEERLEKEILTLESYKDIEVGTPQPFYEKLLLDNEFNFMYGWPKIGKTRALLHCINSALPQGKKCAVLSTDNDKNMVLKPLFKQMKCEKNFDNINDKLGKVFDSPDIKPIEKLAVFIERVESILKNNKNIKCLLIDPLPRIIDYNNEVLVSALVDNLRILAKKYEVCIIGVRNEGKSKLLTGDAAYKGSSALADDSRQTIRAILCHRRSAYARTTDKKNKNDKPNKRVVLYSVFSSNFQEQAFLFEIRPEQNGKIGVPYLIRKLTDNMDVVQFKASSESGRTLSNQMIKFMEKQKGGGCTLQDLYEAFDEYYKHDHIRKVALATFDHVKKGPVSYFIQKK